MFALLSKFMDVSDFVKEEELFQLTGQASQFGLNATDFERIKDEVFEKEIGGYTTKGIADLGKLQLKEFESKQ